MILDYSQEDGWLGGYNGKKGRKEGKGRKGKEGRRERGVDGWVRYPIVKKCKKNIVISIIP